MQSMTITTPVSAGGGWFKFDLNVGGFEIRGCTWHLETNRLRFPRRRRWPSSKQWITVIRAPQPFVKCLKKLLNAGQLRTKRDRSPCLLKILDLRPAGDQWYSFGFEVRGVKIWGCRWSPVFGSIQFPITYLAGTDYKKRVAHARGSHVLRLRAALEKYAVKRGEISQEMLAVFQEETQERRRQRQLAKAA